jgi:hypothetical protein
MTAVQTTLLPWTTSTDYFATTVNQTPFSAESQRRNFNAWVRAGAPIDPASLAPVVGTGTLTSGSDQITSASTAFVDGQTISGYGVADGTTIIGGGGTSTLTISNPATQTLAQAPLTAGSLLAGQAAHPYAGYFELADQVESARDSGVWAIVNYAGQGDLSDGSNTVANASAGFQNGQAFNSSGTSAGTYVVSGGGTSTLTISLPAAATQSGASVVAAYTSDGIHAAPIADALLAQGVDLSLLS